MSSKKITDLRSYTASEITAGSGVDLLYITDITNQETKKITALEFGKYAMTAGAAYTGSFSGSLIGSVTGSLNGTSSWALNAISAANAGETNTVSNLGSYGYGLYKQKTGVNFDFKKIAQGNNIIISPDSSDSDVLIISANLNSGAGGVEGSIQFNYPAGTFNGDSSFTFAPSIIGSIPTLTIGGKIIANSITSSLNGTSSVALNTVSSSFSTNAFSCTSASYAVTASHATSFSGELSLGGLNSNNFTSSISPNSVDTYDGSYYYFNHSFATTPSLVRATLICNVSDMGYSVNDEISVEQLHDDSGGADDERPITQVWTNGSQVGCSFSDWSGGVYGTSKTGGRDAFDVTKWKIKFRVWK